MEAKPNRPWGQGEITRARRAYNTQIELLMAQVPNGYWFAVNLMTGMPQKGDTVTWPTKKAAVEWINSHGGDANNWLFVQLPHDGIPRTWQSIAAVLRHMDSVEQYHRANSDPSVHLHMPSVPLVDGSAYHA